MASYENKRTIVIDHNKFDTDEENYPAMSKFYSDSSVSAWESDNYALSFDGVDDVVNITSVTLSSDFEIVFDLKLLSGGTYNYTTAQGEMIFGDYPNQTTFLRILNSNEIEIAMSNDAQRPKWTTTGIDYLERHTYKVAKTGTSIELFIDDVSQGVISTSYAFNLSTIGKGWSNNDYVTNGILYDFKIYDSGALIHHYEFNEGTGTTTSDSIGSNSGTINGPTWASGYSKGNKVKHNSAYYKYKENATFNKEPRVDVDWQLDWSWLGDEFDFSKIRSDGKDIRFVASDGSTLLDYERQSLQFAENGYEITTYLQGISQVINGSTYIYEAYQGNTLNGSCYDPDPGILFDLRGINVETIEVDADVAWYNSQPRLRMYSGECVQGAGTSTADISFLGTTTIIEDENLYTTYGNLGTGAKSIQRTYTYEEARNDLSYYMNISSCQRTGDRYLKIKSFKINGKEIVNISSTDYTTSSNTENKTYSQAIFHARIPSVSSSADTDYYMFYNNPEETVDGENKTGVWDDNFVNVIHMGESLTDSSGNGHTPARTGTKVGEGINGTADVFDGTAGDYIDAGSTGSDAGKNYTISALIKITAATPSSADCRIFTQAKATGSTNYRLGFDDSRLFTGMTFDGTSHVTTAGTPSTLNVNQAYLTTLQYDEGILKAILNGVLDSSLTTSDFTTYYGNLQLGRLIDNTTTYLPPLIYDELRVSNIARSSSWIKADDHNLRLWDLQTIGEEEDNMSIESLFFSLNF